MGVFMAASSCVLEGYMNEGRKRSSPKLSQHGSTFECHALYHKAVGHSSTQPRLQHYLDLQNQQQLSPAEAVNLELMCL